MYLDTISSLVQLIAFNGNSALLILFSTPDSRTLQRTAMTTASSDAAARLASRKSIPTPTPAYLPKAGSPLSVDHESYAAIQASPRVLLEEFTLPIRSGRAWKVPAGSVVRISTPEGPQVGKFD